MPIEVTTTPAGQPGFTLDEDTYNRLPDGRNELIGRKGQTIPYHVAVRYGLVKAGPEVEGTDVKSLREAREAADRQVPTPTLDILGQSPGSPEPEAAPAPQVFTRPDPTATPRAARGRPRRVVEPVATGEQGEQGATGEGK